MRSKKFSLIISKPIKNYNKSIFVDSDKSMSIRSFLIGSISNGVSQVKNVLESEDVFSTINCLKKLGIKIIKSRNGAYRIFGKGLGSYKIKNNAILNFGNSGTLSRLILGIITSTPNIRIKVSGDKSLNSRSMEKLIKLLSQFGAEFYPKKKKFFPLTFYSSNYPIGINYKAGTSAQLKSAVILAGLNSFGNTNILEKNRTRDHTENMMKNNNQVIKISNGKERKIKVFGKRYLNKFELSIPGDPSSAAFFTALTLLKDNSSIRIKRVGLNPARIGFFSLLKKSGAKIKFLNVRKIKNERIGDIFVRSSKLRPIKASKKYYLSATDEYPILFAISALINGKSTYYGISDLKNKESNRITEMQKILKQIGIKTNYSKDKLVINGKKLSSCGKKNVKVANLGDHRICMSSAVLALLTGAKIKIKNFETVRTSSPNFLKIIKTLGASFETKKI